MGCPMYILSQKLKNLICQLKSWNKEVFGDVHLMINPAQAEVDLVQDQIAMNGMDDVPMDRDKEAQLQLQKALHFQEVFWKEKSRINWHKFGDRNTAFFHKATKIRNASQRMTMLKVGDQILDNQEDI